MKTKLFYAFDVNSWRGAKIEPLMKHSTFEWLTEYSPIVSDARYRKVRGNQLCDLLVYATGIPIFLISEKFRNILDENGFNGYKCFPIKSIEGVEATYYGWLNTNESGFVSKIYPANYMNTNPEYLVFNLKTWKNYNIFHLKDTLWNICTPEVKSILEKHKITNLKFIPKYIGFEIDEEMFMQKRWDEEIPTKDKFIEYELYKLTQKMDTDFTLEDLHFVIRSEIGLSTYIPIAIDKIISREFANIERSEEMKWTRSEFLESILLCSIMETSLDYWNKYFNAYNRLKTFLSNMTNKEIDDMSKGLLGFKNQINNFINLDINNLQVTN